MDKIDWLLLHYVHRLTIKVSDLYRENLGEYLNMPEHGLTKGQIVKRLKSLGEKRLISFQANDYSRSFNFSPESRYYLTPYGGKMWEQVFLPNWHLFIDSTEEPIADSCNLTVVKACSKDLIKQYIEKTLDDFYVREISNWYATYWKKIENGYICVYLEDILEQPINHSSDNVDFQWYKNWEDI